MENTLWRAEKGWRNTLAELLEDNSSRRAMPIGHRPTSVVAQDFYLSWTKFLCADPIFELNR